ncbi:MAG: DUF4125 family protein [Butyrivibrio sp.]|nr:DUF4125 family protein [Acetatifactor muris]MCM1558376.1 DUF4125 family protein [Butyrivibrio sp.]
MNIQEIILQIDKLLEENKREEAEKLMQESIARAVAEQDDGSLLRLLNELLGFYRETGRHEEAYLIGDRAVAQAERMGLTGTVPYATTQLNVANAYRAGGRLKESLEKYLQVQEIYRQQLSPDDMLAAGFQNNFSLLYQELGEYGKARECLLKALQIVKEKGSSYELGVTYANLAATCVQLEQMEEAGEYAAKSMEVFEKAGIMDSHYGAALSALGAWHFHRREYGEAGDAYRRAMELVERCNGRNHAYLRLKENAEECKRRCTRTAAGAEDDGTVPGGAVSGTTGGSAAEAGRDLPEDGTAEAMAAADRPETEENRGGIGLALSRDYYEAYGAPVIREQFGEYENRIAVGLVGRGSDCFGYDDELSLDHDWGPDFCMWVTDETYAEIGGRLQEAYEDLPAEYKGYRRAPHVNGRNRRGVLRISEFYRGLVGAERYEEIDWRSVSDAALAAAVNGAVFRDDEGIFTAFRNRLLRGYPENIFYLKLAEAGAKYAQAAEYNFMRMLERGDELTARMFAWDGVREAMRIQLYLDGKYPPHDKWLHRSLKESDEGRRVAALLEDAGKLLSASPGDGRRLQKKLEELGGFLARELYRRDIISDIDSYLDAHSQELVCKAAMAEKDSVALAEEIAGLEFEAFDKVQNEGGRAGCQNDWFTFSIMRKSQYLTWDKTMLLQYFYDFRREYERGHNLITEKYGRMMESTAPEKYEELKKHFPELTEEKQNIIRQICSMQVQWMEEFAAAYPQLADNARSIHTSEDSAFNTSYETYLRGELGTYSDKMLELYGRYIVKYARENRNPVYDIMENSVKMYGYQNLEEAERKAAAAMS